MSELSPGTLGFGITIFSAASAKLYIVFPSSGLSSISHCTKSVNSLVTKGSGFTTKLNDPVVTQPVTLSTNRTKISSDVEE